MQARELIRHHSAIVVADVLRVCAYKKRKRVLAERRRQMAASVTPQLLGQMDEQARELDRKVLEAMNRLTQEKILLMKLRKSLIEEFEWPLEELLR